MGPLRTNFSDIVSKFKHFIEEDTFKKVVWEMLSILSRPQCVNWSEKVKQKNMYFFWILWISISGWAKMEIIGQFEIEIW